MVYLVDSLLQGSTETESNLDAFDIVLLKVTPGNILLANRDSRPLDNQLRIAGSLFELQI